MLDSGAEERNREKKRGSRGGAKTGRRIGVTKHPVLETPSGRVAVEPITTGVA